MNIKLIAATTALIGATLGMTPSARAVTISKPMIVDPSMACQLSLPKINNDVRTQANGYRNEGTSGTFVICGTGATHTAVSCTAVNRQSAGGGEAFSTKILDVGPAGASFAWAPADLNTFNGFMNSVTCNMPQGTSITAVRLVFPDDVGS